MLDLRTLLEEAVENGASDVHIKAGVPPRLRLEGELSSAPGSEPCSKEETLEIVRQLLNSRQREQLAQASEIDVSFGMESLGRFRLAVFQQRGTLSLVIRLISDEVPSITELHLPEVLEEIACTPRGLVLVTGVSGSGKTTTLAAMLRHINEHRACHVVTIEDPIEFLFADDKALFSQREVAGDTHSFAAALRSSLRQDPDVIMVGEMRDLETVEIALQAAETGHLVMSTLHTSDAVDTINRVISLFPGSREQDVRSRFASVLEAAVSMRLVPSSVSGKRVPAVEVLRTTEMVESLLLKPERVKEIRDVLANGHAQYGMQSFDQSILSLFENGLITREDALANATSAEDLKLRLQGIVSSSEAI